MKNLKKLEAVIAPPPPHMVGDGFRVNGFMPSHEIPPERMNPFLLLDYMSRHEFPASHIPKGVPPHPHRGMETVTLVYAGEIAHHDNVGNHGIIQHGDVQWMTAGAGILHKEYHSEDFTRRGGVLHGVQLWINLPASDKMAPPRYQDLPHSDMGKVILPNDAGLVNVIAGHFGDVDGPAKTFSPVHIYDIRLHPGAVLEMHLPDGYNSCVLVAEGAARFNGETVAENHLGLFERPSCLVNVDTAVESKLLVLSGKDLGEPIVAHGPFVMTSREEINQAFNDYQSGQFGPLSGW